MCISPNTLQDGTATACHKCWQCNEQAINDWVGRNIAENKTAVASNAVTLTYGRSDDDQVDHLHAAILTYSDVQKYIKLLRFHGYPVRYFVTGEYGSAKGRSHWHIILHWQDKVPPHELQTRFMEKHWPHGLSYWDNHDPAAVRYNCKYILKNMSDDARQGHLAMSKKPPLGHEYFTRLAHEYVGHGLAPQTLEYTFQDIRRRNKDGTQQVVPFRLKDVSADNFLRAYCAEWAAQRPNEAIPASELINEWLTPNDWEYRAIAKRLSELPEASVRTPSERKQVLIDADRWAALDRDRKQAALWKERLELSVKRELNPVVRYGPRDIAEWNHQWERQNRSGQERQKQREIIANLAERVEAICSETYARQGRVKATGETGEAIYVNKADQGRCSARPR